MKRRMLRIIGACVMAGILITGSALMALAYQDPGGQPDIVGVYSFSTNMNLFDLDRARVVDEGARVSSRTAILTIDSQTDDAITGTLDLENIAEGLGAIALTGYVADPGRMARIVMYGVPPAVPDGDNFVVIVTAYVKYDTTTGDATLLRGIVIDGIDQNGASPYTFNGRASRAYWAELT